MEKFKFILFSIVTLTLVGISAYWAVVTLQSGTEYVAEQKIKQLGEENKELKKETEDLKKELATLQKKFGVEEETPAPAPTEQKPTPAPTPAPTTVYKNQTLINELEKLVASNVFLKLKSQGPGVGTVQRFLNVYNKTSSKVDNDYGPGTVTAVKAFQKDQGLTADGEAGAGTFRKMVEWLKKQG